MTKPPRFLEFVDYATLQTIYAQNSSVLVYAEERNELPPTDYDPPRSCAGGYVVTSLQFIEFKTADIKVGSVFRMNLLSRDAVDVLWWLLVNETLYILRPNIP